MTQPVIDQPIAREAPAPAPLDQRANTCRPNARDEDLLHIRNIQGNILAGFNKDHQTLLFLTIIPGMEAEFKRWLKALIPFIATTSEVLAFNRLFKELRSRRGESKTVKATWINIAFSFNALKHLAGDEADQFTDDSFKQGLAAQSELLGDPPQPTDPAGKIVEGNKHNWVVGGPDNEADVVLIFAGDDQYDLFTEVTRIENSIYAARLPDGTPTRSGARIIYKQHGATLPPPLTGHEHFGFLDGVSQPGVRGRISEHPHDVFTLRQNPTPDQHLKQGKPGQDLLWPGEFVFGYHGQDRTKPVPQPGKDSLREGPDGKPVGPEWAQDGSYLVIRRLRQDVPGFHEFLREQAVALNIGTDVTDGAAAFGAKCVGRWASGAPILRAPDVDNPRMGESDCANNNFEFQAATPAIPQAAADPDPNCLCTDEVKGSMPVQLFPTSPGDPDGQRCPFAGHIRKAYPRNDKTPDGGFDPDKSEQDTQTHRLMRRGIPFGAPYSRPQHPDDKDAGDRGLLFLCYQTSFTRQFEFVTKNWVNEPAFATPDAGIDPILGQRKGEQRERTFKVTYTDNDGNTQNAEVVAPRDWVIPTGGGYFFSPSIKALEETLTAP